MNHFDGAIIEVTNWQKYNPKRAQTTYTWLRLNNNIATDPKLYGLEPDQRYAWVIILCEVSKENDGKYQLNIPFLAHLTGVSEKKLTHLIEFLIKKRIIKSLHQTTLDCSEISEPLHQTTPDCSDPFEALHLRDETDETDETDEENTLAGRSGEIEFGDFEIHKDEVILPEEVQTPLIEKIPKLHFEKIYDEYPRKDGRQEGLKICKARIKSIEDYNDLLCAVRRYRAHCEREGIEKQYIKHFSTFMQKDRWKDWLDPETGTAIETQKLNYDLSRFT